MNKPRIHAALSATLALSAAPSGFTATEFTTKVHTMTGQTDSDYTTRQAAYDQRKLCGKDLITKPSRIHHYHTQPRRQHHRRPGIVYVEGLTAFDYFGREHVRNYNRRSRTPAPPP